MTFESMIEAGRYINKNYLKNKTVEAIRKGINRILNNKNKNPIYDFDWKYINWN